MQIKCILQIFICQNTKIIAYIMMTLMYLWQNKKKVCFTHIHQNVSTCLPVCKLWENCCFSQTKPEIGALVSERESGEGVNIRRG